MKLVSHLLKQPFLTAVSVAAISHSTWSFAVMFTGVEPHPQFTWSWLAWVLPGAIMAFSIDIGLLSLAYQIRSGQRNPSKLAAFAVLSGAMFYAQFVYISSHMPALALAAGVRAEWSGLVQLVRDCSIWIFPALLPVALILYAFSDQDVEQLASAAAQTVETQLESVDVKYIRPEPHHDPALSSVEMPALPAPDAVKEESDDPALEIVPAKSVAATVPTTEKRIRIKTLRTSHKHCGHCGSPLPPTSRRIYCNDSCKQLAYLARKAKVQA
jgi:hypothetical protein